MLETDCKLIPCGESNIEILIQDLRTFQVEIIHSADVPFDLSE
jgi:hypothetical protein